MCHLCVWRGGGGRVGSGVVRCVFVWLSKVLGGNMIPVSKIHDEFGLCYGMLLFRQKLILVSRYRAARQSTNSICSCSSSKAGLPVKQVTAQTNPMT